ncbi:helix-turn-helix domain-containing protein [Streptomyces sp. NBC_00184]|uniref:helix-turn-helix domain-containing protein n=1 Tax=unclassified Streptomyces TaxID=2593676 RepID=UPI002E2E6523|nr:helix-turn-helix domain-containing protein [Streptomyces sp. NBC_00184]
MEWLVEAGLHRRAGATTLAVARDLAGRMDYRLGFVLYDLERTAARCGVSVATVKRHVRVLRELGVLVWRRHGSKRNLRLPGRSYAGTATIYAATIPPVYDEEMGYRLEGVGYGARVVGVTDPGRARAVDAFRTAGHPVDNSDVDRPSSGGRAPHSPGSRHDVPKADPSGRLNYTSRERATSATASTLQGPRGWGGGRGPAAGRGWRDRSPRPSKSGNRPLSRHPLQVARDIAVARQVRPLIDRGLGAHDIAAELHGLALDWRPARPAAYITAALNHDGRTDGPDRRVVQGHAVAPPSAAFSRAVAAVRESSAEVAEAVALAGADGPLPGVDGLTREEVIELRSAAVADRGLILVALENLGERETRRLYTNRLVDRVLAESGGASPAGTSTSTGTGVGACT